MTTKLPTYAEIQNGPNMFKWELVEQIESLLGLSGETDSAIPQDYLEQLAEFATDQRWCLHLVKAYDDTYQMIRTFLAYHYPDNNNGLGQPLGLCQEVQDLIDAYENLQEYEGNCRYNGCRDTGRGFCANCKQVI